MLQFTCTRGFLYARYSLLLFSDKFCNGGEQCGNVTLPHWRGGGEQCGKVTLQHCSPTLHPSSAMGAESEGGTKGGRVRGVETEGAELEGENQSWRGRIRAELER
jgi:hypothetical protein